MHLLTSETCRFVYLDFGILTSYITGFLTIRFTRVVISMIDFVFLTAVRDTVSCNLPFYISLWVRDLKELC